MRIAEKQTGHAIGGAVFNSKTSVTLKYILGYIATSYGKVTNLVASTYTTYKFGLPTTTAVVL